MGRLVTLNIWSPPMFWWPGCKISIPDVSFTSESPVASVNGWWVLDDFWVNDHQFIRFKVPAIAGVNQLRLSPVGTLRKWTSRDSSKLGEREREGISGGVSVKADIFVYPVMNVKKENGALVLLMAPSRVRPPTYWWKAEIANLRHNASERRHTL